MFFWIFETLILKGCYYFLNMANNGSSPPFFELFAYTGYKFVSLCLIIIAQFAFGTLVSYAVLFVTGSLFCLFFFQTIKAHTLGGNTLVEHIRDVSMNKKTLTGAVSLG
jgi:hypothetical protein